MKENPKEIAKEIFESFYKINNDSLDVFKIKQKETAKKNALENVNNIIKYSPSLPILGDGGTYGEDIELSTKLFIQVRDVIEKM